MFPNRTRNLLKTTTTREASKPMILNRNLSLPATIVLDFDHTLIHAVPDNGTVPEECRHLDKFHTPQFEMWIFVRPHAIRFLRFLFHNSKDLFRVVFWTAGTREYAKSVHDGLMSLVAMPHAAVDEMWNREHTIITPDGFVKDLGTICEHLGVPLASCVLIDDDPSHALYPPNITARRLRVPHFRVHKVGCVHDAYFFHLLNDFYLQVTHWYTLRDATRKCVANDIVHKKKTDQGVKRIHGCLRPMMRARTSLSRSSYL